MSSPILLTDSDIVPPVWGVLRTPRGGTPRPGVVVLPGSSGWHSQYVEIAGTLAAAGFVAMALDYLAESGREPSPEAEMHHWQTWEDTVRNAIGHLQQTWCRHHPPIGLVGYSLGAYLAVSVASALPEVKAVVEFFGGGGRGPKSLEDQVSALPPLLILHGEADSVVPLASGCQLRDAALAQGRHVEMHTYPGAEHAFNASWNPHYSESEAADSTLRTIEFLHQWLGA
jgi:carboxymethylenebutenolidase